MIMGGGKKDMAVRGWADEDVKIGDLFFEM